MKPYEHRAVRPSTQLFKNWSHQFGWVWLALFLAMGLAHLGDAQSYTLTLIWSITNGTANLVNDNNNRGLAYNLSSNQVYVAGRTTIAKAISVLDGASGAVIANNFPNISILPYHVGVADDGVIYGVPLANGVGSANLNIYSWTNWTSVQRQCYSQTGGDATSLAAVQGQRVGDSFAIRGGGTQTLILLPINNGTSAGSATNMLLFSTADGQSFTPTVIAISGLPAPFSDAGPEHGVAFVDSTHFLFRPGAGSATYLIQIPPDFASLTSPVPGLVIATNNSLPGASGGVCFLACSPAGKLLADYGPMANTGTSVPLTLFDVSSFPAANALGATNTPHRNANANLTGAVALGGAGKTNALYVLDSNNQVFGFRLAFTPMPLAPSIGNGPAGASLYTNYGSYTFTVTAAGAAPLTYYWQYNSVSNLATAATLLVTSNNFYTISNLTLAASGWYDVVVSNTVGSTRSLPVQLSVAAPLASVYVTNLWNLPADNSQPYLDTNYNTRGLAFDPNTMSVLVAEHSAAQIYALNATNGQFKFAITTPLTGLPLGSIFPVGQVGVADDGVVYVCNVSSYQPGQQNIPGYDFSITRFDSVVSSTNADGSLNPANTFEAAFTGDPGAYSPGGNPSSLDRWGDSMAVRGAGTDTEILLGTYLTVGNNEYGTGPGTNVAILTTTDGVDFTPTTIAVTNAPDGFSYLGVAWGAGNTFWAKSPDFDLYQVQFDLNTGYGRVIQDFSSMASAGSLSQISGIGLDVSNNILAGVNIGDAPNDLELFQIPSLGFPPLAYFQAFYPVYKANINGNAATTIKFPYIFSLDANNGIIGLQYSIPLLPFTILVCHVGNHEVLSWPTMVGHSYQLQSSSILGGAWSNMGPSIQATASATWSYTNNALSSPSLFYRVVAR